MALFKNLFRLVVILATALRSDTRTFKLGMMSPFKHPRLGWENNAAAASLAVEKAAVEGILDGYDVSIKWRDDQCNAPGGTKSTMLLREEDDVDVFIGPPCSGSTTPSGLLAAYWNLPMFSQASSDPSLADKSVYRTLVRLGPPFNKMGKALVELFRFYNWDTVSIISKRKTDNRNVFCDYSSRSVEEQFRDNNIVINDWVLIDTGLSDTEIVRVLDRIRQRARIIVLCTEIPDDRRRILLKAQEMGMTDGSFVYLLPDHLPPSNVATPWLKQKPDDDRAKLAYKSAFQITVAEMAGKEVESFRDDVTQRMAGSPWNFTTTLRGSEYSAFLYDVVYLYLLVLNETLAEGGDPRNGTALFERAIGKTFRGITGNVKVDSNGDREPDYWIWDLAPSGDKFEVALEAALTSNSSQKIVTIRPVDWDTHDGRPPPSVPVCGFRNQHCPAEGSDKKAVVITLSVVTVVVVCLGIVGFVLYRRSRFERELQQQLWLAHYSDIKLTKAKITGSISQISIRTSNVTVSRGSSGMVEGQLFSQIGLYKGNVVAVKKLDRHHHLQLSREDLLELKVLKEMQFENVNAFLGMCTDARFPCILTAYCSKGSLQDIIENDDIKLDLMFKVSLLTDLVGGINYLHSSPLHWHGSLKSSNCVIDNRWVLKVTDFGLPKIRQYTKRGLTEYQEQAGLFWTSPELLNKIGVSQKGDVYAMGIIFFEILYRRPPYDTTFNTPSGKSNVKTRIGNIISRVYARETPPFRPPCTLSQEEKCLEDIVPKTAIDIMEKCWSDLPENRPTVSTLKKDIIKLHAGKKVSIVDNMVQMLEKYANNLEDIVEQRTVQLIEEKKKTDTLLYRMLPESVAERLKSGNTVQPEVFDSVTIYFSDIVGFTALSSESTAIEIVDFLNDLYTSFDSTISQYDVYKVETIGDAYMVVSGLPMRNGNRHCCEIADMSLELLLSISVFRIRHKPNRKLQLRIGMHTGACAAGVVGKTMPRYCLFGDTVNMASRMESTGEAMKIHISQAARDALQRTSSYIIQTRCQMEIKGKGLQTTYWLIGKT